MPHMPLNNKLKNALPKLKTGLVLRENNKICQLMFLNVKSRFYAGILFILKSNILTTLRRK